MLNLSDGGGGGLESTSQLRNYLSEGVPSVASTVPNLSAGRSGNTGNANVIL